MRRNIELLKALADNLSKEEVTSYIDIMAQQFMQPNVSVHYPAEATEDDADEAPTNKYTNKKEQIQSYCLQVLSMTPTLFKHCLTSEHI